MRARASSASAVRLGLRDRIGADNGDDRDAAPAVLIGRGDLVLRCRRIAPRARHAHAVVADLLERDLREIRDHVRKDVGSADRRLRTAPVRRRRPARSARRCCPASTARSCRRFCRTRSDSRYSPSPAPSPSRYARRRSIAARIPGCGRQGCRLRAGRNRRPSSRNSCIRMPSASAESAQRPVITISAPRSSAAAIGSAPR